MPTDISTSSTETFDSTVNAPAGGDPRTSASVRTPMQNIVNRVRFTWARVQELAGSFLPLRSLFPIALSVASSTFTLTGHGLSANDPVQLWAIGSGAALPSPLSASTIYYAVNVTENTFQVSATSGGGAITLTNVGSGAIYGAKLFASTVMQQISSVISQINAFVHPGSITRTSSASIFNLTSGAISNSIATLATGDHVSQVLDPPHGSTFTAASVYILPGSHSALPATLPALAIYRYNMVSGNTTLIGGPVTDPSGSTGAYDASHAITVGGMTEVVDRTQNVYRVSFINESGANSTSGVLYLGSTWTATV